MKIYREAKGLPEPQEKPEEKAKETTAPTEAPRQTVAEDEETAPTPEELKNRPTQQAVNPYLPRNEISFAPRQPQQSQQQPDNSEEPGTAQTPETDKDKSQFGSMWDQNVNGRQ